MEKEKRYHADKIHLYVDNSKESQDAEKLLMRNGLTFELVRNSNIETNRFQMSDDGGHSHTTSISRTVRKPRRPSLLTNECSWHGLESIKRYVEHSRFMSKLI